MLQMPSQLSRSRNAWVAKAKQAVGKALGMENSALYQQIGRLQAEISALNEGFREFRSETRTTLKALEAKIDKIEDTVTPLDSWQRGAKGVVEKLDARMGRVEAVLKQSYGVLTLTITVIGLVVSGFWWVLLNWGAVGPALARFLGFKA